MLLGLKRKTSLLSLVFDIILQRQKEKKPDKEKNASKPTSNPKTSKQQDNVTVTRRLSRLKKVYYQYDPRNQNHLSHLLYREKSIHYQYFHRNQIHSSCFLFLYLSLRSSLGLRPSGRPPWLPPGRRGARSLLSFVRRSLVLALARRGRPP